MQRHDRHGKLCVACRKQSCETQRTGGVQALERSLRFSGENEKADTAADHETKLSEAARLAKFGLKKEAGWR